jgi:hypothetical protein
MSTSEIRISTILCAVLAVAPFATAQSLSRATPAIREAIDESKLGTLTNNTRPEAVPVNDRGRVADDFPLRHMLLQLKRSPENEAALQRYIDDLHNSSSPNFHHWLTSEQFARNYGVASADVEKVTGWLKGRGFTVHGTAANGMVVDFSGTAGLVEAAYHTEIHNLSVDGAAHFANMSDPRIPIALAPVVAGVVSLHNFHPKPQLVRRNPQYTFTNSNGTFHSLAPGDIATIYNLNPLFAAGLSGKGQTIMVLEDTYLYSTGDWTVFRKTFGLARTYPYGTLSQVSGCPETARTCCRRGRPRWRIARRAGTGRARECR